MAKIRVISLGEKILVSRDNKSARLYLKSKSEFVIDEYNVSFLYDGTNVLTEKTEDFDEPREKSPVDLSIKLNNIISSVPAQELTLDELQAIQNAENPSASNPFVTEDQLEFLDNRIIVNQDNIADTIGGVIDSTKEYFLDGIIDLGTTQITVPTTGITIKGYSFDVSGLISSEDNYTMFVSESIAIGSGNLLGSDYFVSVTGAASKVYELYDATGFNAFEFTRINYIDCTDLGDIYDYRQGLESGTGRFGGSPSLTLHGLWRGGYRITTSIVRSLAGTMTKPLFKEGTLFQMNSRFLSDINCDLPTLAALLDFQDINFPNPSTLQLKGCEITRNGVFDSEDGNITPNILQSDLASSWGGNNGLPNTYEGGRLYVSSESATVVAAGSTWYTLNATWTSNRLEHFDSPSSGQLRHLGNSPREFRCVVNFVMESLSNNVLGLRLRKWDDSTSSFSEFTEVRRQVNNLSGARDVAVFNFVFNVNLDQNDYVYFQVRNNNGNNNITLELDSDWFLEER